jgi:hypothetical protein
VPFPGTLNPVTVIEPPFGLIVFVVFHDAMPADVKGAMIINRTSAVATLRRLACMPQTSVQSFIECHGACIEKSRLLPQVEIGSLAADFRNTWVRLRFLAV